MFAVPIYPRLGELAYPPRLGPESAKYVPKIRIIGVYHRQVKHFNGKGLIGLYSEPLAPNLKPQTPETCSKTDVSQEYEKQKVGVIFRHGNRMLPPGSPKPRTQCFVV